MKLYFNLNFNTKIGEKLQIVVTEKGYDDQIHLMSYNGNGNWIAEVDFFSKSIRYKYQLTNEDGSILDEEYVFHSLSFPHTIKEYKIFDSWNLKNFPENYLNNKIFKKRLGNFKPEKCTVLKKHTHYFRLEAPLYNRNWRMVILGNVKALGNWEYLKTIPMMQTAPGIWETAVEIQDKNFIQYKYGVMDVTSGEVFDIEYGENRWVIPQIEEHVLTVKADHFFRYKSFEMYHAAGVAIPVFSLRSVNGFGVGEFSDLKLMADWAVQTNLSVIQILPINDTTTNYSWTDSYPYAAISVYALHPQYLSLENLDFPLPEAVKENYLLLKSDLNSKSKIDYEKMIVEKWRFLKIIFQENIDQIINDRHFKKFQKENEKWLFPYAAFCVQRDKNRTPNFNIWKTHKKYIAGKIASVFKPKSKDFQHAMLHCWVQFQLHKQLKDAVDYMSSLGISLKGDLPIGIYRYSVEAWTEPELFNMDFQAGAPPDHFTDLGQNWEFPTYNWDAMKVDGYQWWKNRFEALEQYFDAIRIDHILGFFRIWKIPVSATQGVLGYFDPAVPVKMEEFHARFIPFNFDRYCKPFINDQILWDYFGEEKENISYYFMNNHFNGTYSFKEDFNTQRKIKDYFEKNPHVWAEEKLISLCANVLFLHEEKNGETVYHPRFNLFKTDSYRYLSDWEKESIYYLYSDYFFHRQNALWYKSGMEKLPPIITTSQMMICAEDLGFIPECVPQVMDRLGINALKVQRMPSENISFYNPQNASYLNVVTSSSHDSSTLRQWWRENRSVTVKYFHEQLSQYGSPPENLEPQLAEIIMKQHLYNDAMLAVFPIQEFLATDYRLRNPQQDEERINNPSVFPHYWRYRMHVSMENLIEEACFNSKIAGWIEDSGRK